MLCTTQEKIAAPNLRCSNRPWGLMFHVEEDEDKEEEEEEEEETVVVKHVE
jgi:hypothetical protein